MKERKIVIATHGTLAEGFRSALKIIATDEGVETYCCYTTPDFNLEKTIQTIMDAYDEETQELYVFTDLYGGSVNNGFVNALKNHQFHLTTNTTLGVLIDFILTNPNQDEIETKLNSNDFKAVYCNTALVNIEGIEEDL